MANCQQRGYLDVRKAAHYARGPKQRPLTKAQLCRRLSAEGEPGYGPPYGRKPRVSPRAVARKKTPTRKTKTPTGKAKTPTKRKPSGGSAKTKRAGKKTPRGARKAPAESATAFPEGTVMQGLDGYLWHIVVNKNGVHSWRKLPAEEQTGATRLYEEQIYG